jgi:hypothetical protein
LKGVLADKDGKLTAGKQFAAGFGAGVVEVRDDTHTCVYVLYRHQITVCM